MKQTPVRFLGTGACLPSRVVTAETLEHDLSLPPGWIAQNTGVLTRHVVDGESASEMGAAAARAALDDAGLALTDIDCLMCTSGTWEQAIPCTASLILRHLQGDARHRIAAFDVNATCLGFLTGLDLAAAALATGRWRRILMVASDVTSAGLDWDDPASATLFGDGAAAAVLALASPDTSSALLASAMETHAEAADLCEIRGGGSRVHPRHYSETTRKDFLFRMDGPAVFRLTSQVLPEFVERLLDDAGLRHADIDTVIPHQASPTALRLMERRLGFRRGSFHVIAPRVGNMVAASIPLALHDAIRSGRVQRGERILLVGTSAGFSMGGAILVF